MEVEFTARKVKISKALRMQAEEGMERIARILGRNACASIVFSAQKRVQIAEVTVKARLQTIVAAGEAETQDAALRQAIEHVESQALRRRDRRIESKRLPKEEKVLTAPRVARPKTRAAQPEEDAEEEKPDRTSKKARAAIPVHSFPAQKAVVAPHVVTNGEAFSMTPMTVEEAVKEAEFRDRDLLVFHNPSGELFVLHRRRDGEMELVEILRASHSLSADGFSISAPAFGVGAGMERIFRLPAWPPCRAQKPSFGVGCAHDAFQACHPSDLRAPGRYQTRHQGSPEQGAGHRYRNLRRRQSFGAQGIRGSWLSRRGQPALELLPILLRWLKNPLRFKVRQS